MPAKGDTPAGASGPAGRTRRPKPLESTETRDDGQVGYLAIARVVAPHGVRGELRADVLTDFPQRFGRLSTVYLGPAHVAYQVEAARMHKRQVILKLAGVATVEQAEALRGMLVCVASADAVPLAEGQYYWHQIIGLEVETTDGRRLGRIEDILRTGSNDVYVLHAGRREILIPAIEDVVKEIDLARRRMVVAPLPGMLD